MEDLNVTLGEIMTYCEANGIELIIPDEAPTVVSNIQAYGDRRAQEYFTYYDEHKEAIDAWIAIYRENLNEETHKTMR